MKLFSFTPWSIGLIIGALVNLLPGAWLHAACTPLPDGLVAWWPAEGTANDSAGTNHGTLFGGVSYALGKVGQGFRLDGTNSYLSIPDSAALKPANVSLEAWVWLDPNSNTNTSEVVIFKRNTWTFFFEGYSLLKEHMDNGSGSFVDRFSAVVTSGGNQVITRSTTAVQRGVWYHVAATYDGATLRLFVNGVSEASAYAGFALDYGDLPIFIGSTGIPGNYVNYFGGIIDEPSIYNRALTTNEVLGIYQAASAGKCNSSSTLYGSSLVLDLPLDGSAADVGPNHFTVTTNGGGLFVTNRFLQASSALALDGVGQNLSVPFDARLNPTEFTFSAWAKFRSIQGTLWRSGNATTDAWRGFGLLLDGGVLTYFDVTGSSYNAVVYGSSNLVAGIWYQLVVTRTTNTCIIYVNGVPTGSQTGLTPYAKTQVTPMSFGSNLDDPNGYAQFCPVTLDTVHLYNRALSSNEVAQLYQFEAPGGATPTAPSIIQQPTNTTVSMNNTAIFTVTATGTQPLSYQWSLNGTNILDATNTTLTLNNVSPSQAGNYSVLVSNFVGTAISSNALLGVSSLFCTATPSGLISWWRAENTGVDSVGNNTGVLCPGTGFAAGKVGQCFSFDGISGCVMNTNTPSFTNIINTFTMEFWAVPQKQINLLPEGDGSGGTSGQSYVIFPDFGGIYEDRAGVGVSVGTNGICVIEHKDGYMPSLLTYTASLSGWIHVAVVYVNKQPELYLNGLKVRTGLTSPRAVVYPGKNLGSMYGDVSVWPTYGPYQGLLDETSIYNRALTTNEILAIYQAGSAGKCYTPAPPTLVSQPVSQNVLFGNYCSFAVTASNATPVSYQWSFNGTPLDGATNATLYLGNVQNEQAGNYSVTASSSGSSLTSSNALLTVQTVVAWGRNDFGETNVPVGLNQVRFITAGAYGSWVAKADGTSVSWGGLPSPPSNSDNLVEVHPSYNFGIALQVDHKPVIFGGSAYGETDIPADVTNCLSVAAGGFHGLAARANGTVAAWGHNGYNQSTVPAGLSNVVLVAAGNYHSLALKSDGTVKCWGWGAYGQCDVPTNLNNVIAIAGGYWQSLALTADGAVFGWGGGLPVPAGLSNVVAIACGDQHNLALKSDGTLVAWGDNSYGQTNIATGISNVLQVAAGNYHNVLLLGKAAPQIMRQPVSLNVSNGSPALFYAPTLGRLPLRYQWLRNGNALSGATNASLILNTTSLADEGSYSLLVTNSFGSVTSAVATLTVPLAPAWLLVPTNQTAIVGQTVTLTASANGSSPLRYQWFFNGNPLADSSQTSGSTAAALTISNLQFANSGSYFVVVTNAYGVLSSSNATLDVFPVPTSPMILAQTPSQVVLLSSTATFNVNVSGTAPLSYFWKRNNVFIPGATNAFYALANAQLSDSGSKFSCFVTNAYGTASSTNVTLKVLDTIANDLCSGAIVITNSSYTNTQSTARASSFGDPAPDCVAGFGNGVWYQFTASASGLLTVDTFGSDFDTGLAIYSGACGELTQLACNDDTGGQNSSVTIPTTAGVTYSILVGGYGAHVGNLVLHLNHFTPPAFDVQPTNIAVIVSSNAQFSAAASGTQPISLQWYFNNAPLADGGRFSGVTNATLNIANIITNDGGYYFVVASNFVGVMTSSVAVLTPIILPPFFIVQPLSQSIPAGSNVTFYAVVDGTPPYSFQWSLNGTPLADDGVHVSGSTTTSLSISNLTTADAGNYTLLVTNVVGATNSFAGVLTVLVPPSITLNPIGRSVPPGLPTIFTANASGISTPSFQWQLNGTNLPGATSKNYTNPAVTANNLGLYTFVASNSVGTATSSAAQLTFGPVAAWGRNLNNECLPPPGLSNVIAVAGTYQSSFAVRADGTLTAWGSTTTTNISANTTNVVALFTSGSVIALRANGAISDLSGNFILGVSNVVSVALGNFGSFALRADGTLVSLGQNIIPVGLNRLSAIAAGSSHALALRSDGTVAAWGSGAATNIPIGLSNVIGIAAGPTHSLALRANGTVAAWGSGTGTNLPAGLTNIAAIYASGYVQTPNLCLAVRANGTVVAWGDNPFGETNPPAALTNLLTVTAAAVPNHGLALVNDGTPQILQPPIGLTAFTGRDVTLRAVAAGAAPLSYQWLFNGTNLDGATNASLSMVNLQLANTGGYQLFVSNAIGTTISLPAPINVIVSPLSIASQITATPTNLYQAGKFTINGLTVNGSGPLRYQWFFSRTNNGYTPVVGATNDTLVKDPAFAFDTGNYYVAVSNLAGGLTSAPVNVRVQFARGFGYTAMTNPPVNVTNAVALATGGSSGSPYGHYVALGADGKVTAWANYLQTSGVLGETNLASLSNSIVTAIAASASHTLALKSDGTISVFGGGATNVPAGLSGITAITCGGTHDLALKSDGTVIGWLTPNAVNYGQATNTVAATNIVAIAAGQYHSLGLRSDGTVIGWGNPDGTTSIPTTTVNATIAIAAGNGFSVALRTNGTLVQWGNGIASYPVPANLSNVVAVSASGTHVSALKNDGTVVSWGYEYINFAASNLPPDLANVVALASGGEHDIALFGTRAPAFTVQPWNRAVTNPAIGISTVLLHGRCAGVQPIRYQWRLNGTNFPGATNDTLALVADAPFQIPAGTYQLVASNSYGVTISKPAKVSIVIPLAVALDTVNGQGIATLNWLTSGSTPWFGQTNYVHPVVTTVNSSAARSGGIGGSQETVLQTTLATNVAGSVSFWWKVSSEQFFDTLEFRINGTVQASISGEVDWQFASFPVSAGTNVLLWRYSKDSSFDSGLDAAFVDQFSFASAPVITLQPTAVVANLGQNVSVRVIATGTAPMSYQWFRNGSPISGGISSTYTMLNVARAQNGSYSVMVTNAGGLAVSSNAVVIIKVPQLLTSPVMLPDGSLQLTSGDANGGLLTPADLANFEAQASTNLVDWTTLANAMSLTNGLLQLQDAARTNFDTRYYRIVEH